MRIRHIVLRALLFASTMVAGIAGAIAATNEYVTVRPQETGEALVNPGMVWTLHFYSNFIGNYGSKLIQRSDIGNSDGSEVRRAFQQAAVDALGK